MEAARGLNNSVSSWAAFEARERRRLWFGHMGAGRRHPEAVGEDHTQVIAIDTTGRARAHRLPLLPQLRSYAGDVGTAGDDPCGNLVIGKPGVSHIEDRTVAIESRNGALSPAMLRRGTDALREASQNPQLGLQHTILAAPPRIALVEDGSRT